jgi:hypothetical protein
MPSIIETVAIPSGGRLFTTAAAGPGGDCKFVVKSLCPLYRPADSAYYMALLIYTCFCAYTMQARSTANGKIRREIQNHQIFETDPESFSQAIYFNRVETSRPLKI